MQTVYKISVMLLAAVILTIAVFSLYAFFDSGNLVSESENRTLEPFPCFSSDSWFSGCYCIDLDCYLSDHVLLREALIPITRMLERWMRVQTRIRIVDMCRPN